jgi:hypothetical protein
MVDAPGFGPEVEARLSRLTGWPCVACRVAALSDIGPPSHFPSERLDRTTAVTSPGPQGCNAREAAYSSLGVVGCLKRVRWPQGWPHDRRTALGLQTENPAEAGLSFVGRDGIEPSTDGL